MVFPDSLTMAVFDQAALPLVLVDGSGVFALWNHAFALLFESISGMTPDRFGSSFFEFIADREGARLNYFAAEILLGGKKSSSVESSILDGDGQQRWLHYALSCIEAGAEPAQDRLPLKPQRFLLLAIDEITDRVKRERTLEEARDEAEKATHTKSQFLANMSHEIRTPIQTILGVVELLHETELDSEQLAYVDQVRFSADVLLGLINDILDFSKIEAGRLEIETTSFDLRSWVNKSVELLAMEAGRKGLEIIVDIDDTLPTLVRGDPGRIRQVIINLFKNAIKFTRSGGIALYVRNKAQGYQLKPRPIATDPASQAQQDSQKQQTLVLFEVADTGDGIAEEVRQQLFTPFFQGDRAQARRTGGTGLGLAISRHLVEAMGGLIGVRSQEGRGSVFWFELPLASPDFSALPQKPILPPEASRARILVVDDYSETLQYVSRLIAEAGPRVESVLSGEEALQTMREAAQKGDPFTVCLIDQQMPKMDGWRLASEITSDTSINDARLLLMAPLGSINADAKMKLLRWFNGYIFKPIKSPELFEALARALSSEVDLEDAESADEVRDMPVQRRFTGTVLLAEDHEVNRELFTILLNKAGCTVTTAQDGVEALEAGLRQSFDLTLMDISMPRMTGYEACIKLRAQGYKAPIIAVTASALKGEKEECLASGMDDILVKPFKKEELEELLSRYLPAEGSENHASASGKAAKQGSSPLSAAAEEPAATAGPEREKASPAAEKPAVSDPLVFDWEGVLDTFLGQKATVSGLLIRFIDKAGNQVRELEAALEAKDSQKIREISHSLKGASWNLSAKKLGDAALLGETAGREKNLEAAALAIPRIKEAYLEFMAAAKPYAGGL